MCGGGWVESEFSDRHWLSFSLALAKPNNYRAVKIKGGSATPARLCLFVINVIRVVIIYYLHGVTVLEGVLLLAWPDQICFIRVVTLAWL